MNIILIQALVFIVIFIGIIFAMSKMKGKWGVNVQKVFCPRCGTEAPSVRTPTSAKQAVWGGWSCEKCGSELDKFGKLIEEDNQREVTKNYVAENYSIPTSPVEHFDADNKTPIERVFSQKQKNQ